MRKVLVAVAALLLSGCASEEPTDGTADVAGALADAAAPLPFADARQPLRFASGDYEGEMADQVTFGPTDVCFPDCGPNAVKSFDLSGIIPAGAPVELSITIDGSARGYLEYEDADAVMSSSQAGGQGSEISALVTRGESGSIVLHVYNGNFFFNGFPPGGETTSTFEVRTVVRADRLVAYMPAAIRLQPGDQLELTGDDVEEAILIDPAGEMTRDAVAPFVMTANGTAGEYTLLMLGEDSTAVYGPNGTTMAARRVTFVESEPQPLTSGTPATMGFTPEARPLQVGVFIQSGSAVPGFFFPVGSTMQSFQATLTGPGGVTFIDESHQCTPFCNFVLGSSAYGMGSDFLDGRLAAGSYEASVTVQGTNMQAITWYAYIAA